MGTPDAEVDIDTILVRRLLAEQCPDLASLPLEFVASGWDNVMFRLGDALAMRLPRRRVGAQLIEHEQTWLPQLAPHLPLAVPSAMRCGQPALDYPFKWSVLPWIAGTPASHSPIDDSEASRFAAFLKALHVPAPSDAPRNPVRGVPLVERATAVAERMARLATRTNLITPMLHEIWQQALGAPLAENPVWLHGDLHPGNILLENHRLSGIIDWGDMTAGDPATDLAAIWMLFDTPDARRQVLAEYGGISAALRLRALGWAILFGVMLLDVGMTDTPKFTIIGASTLRRVCDDSGSRT